MEWDLIWELVAQTGQVSGLEMAVRASWELPSSVCPGCLRVACRDWVHTCLHCYFKTVLWGTLYIYFQGTTVERLSVLASSFSAGCSWCPPGTNTALKMGQSLWITTTTVVNDTTLKCLMAVNGITWTREEGMDPNFTLGSIKRDFLSSLSLKDCSLPVCSAGRTAWMHWTKLVAFAVVLSC